MVVGLHHTRFQKNVERILLPMLAATMEMRNMDDLKKVMYEAFDREIREKMQAEPEEQGVTLTLKRRVRYWTEVLIIGSELFVREVMGRVHDKNIASGRRLTELKDTNDMGVKLYAWRHFRI
ncbi:MAG: hypothetical protein EOM12_14650 [Verrucomicrobiae bacterium]|nr:hypothetical protein [Verrucomicrobiae bacterium]